MPPTFMFRPIALGEPLNASRLFNWAALDPKMLRPSDFSMQMTSIGAAAKPTLLFRQ